jgi:hypothetical protein
MFPLTSGLASTPRRHGHHAAGLAFLAGRRSSKATRGEPGDAAARNAAVTTDWAALSETGCVDFYLDGPWD